MATEQSWRWREGSRVDFKRGTFGKDEGLERAPDIYLASTRHWADIISDHCHDNPMA